MFQALEGHINNYIAQALFKIAAAPPPPAISLGQNLRYNDPSMMASASAALSASNAVVHQAAKMTVGRNDPCPCGAMKADGKPIKYKHCHGKNV